MDMKSTTKIATTEEKPMTTTYTVMTMHGDVIDRGLNVTEAAEVVLAHDGYRYEVRKSAPLSDPDRLGAVWYFELFVSEYSANSPHGAREMVRCNVPGTYARAEGEAWPEIAAEVVRASGNWRKSPVVMTDADYDAMMQQLANE